MKRNVLFAGIFAWAMIAALLLGVMILVLVGVIEMPSFVSTSKTELLREDSFSIDELMNLSIQGRSEDIRVTLVSGDRITVRQYGNPDVDQAFTDERKPTVGGFALTVAVPSRVRFLLFHWWSENYLEIELPSQYDKALELSSSSGDVHLPGWDSGDALTLSSTSGEVVLGACSANSLSVSSVSGGIRMENASVTGHVNIETTSGGVHAADIQAQSAHVKSVSGGINLGRVTLDGQAELRVTSGDIRAEALYCRDYDVSSISGRISFAAALQGGGRLHTTSGGIAAEGVSVTGPVTVSSTSGGVRLSLAPGQQCELALSSTTGGFHGNVPLSYGGNRRSATCIIGDGGPLVSVSTVSGGITVDAFEPPPSSE